MADIELRNVSPKDAIAVLARRQANPVPTFSWLDVWQQQHSDMFTAAKTAGFDVLGDIEKAVDDAIKSGETFDSFQKKLTPILQSKGWWGRAPVVDDQTGEVVNAQLGSVRRLQTIFDTNMRVSYSAGRYVQQQRNKADLPYLMYLHGGSIHPRPMHLAWHHTCLPADDPWWDTHYAPNGWGCSCSVVAISQTQYDTLNAGKKIKTVAPPMNWRPFTNARTGQTVQVPEGIDPGFAYNPGKAFLTAVGGTK